MTNNSHTRKLLFTTLTLLFLTGFSSAAVTNFEINNPGQSPFQPSDSVGLAADSSGNDITFAIDADDSGSIESDEAIDTITGSGTTAFTPETFDGISSSTVGDFNAYAVEESNDDGSEDTLPSTSDSSVTVTIDGANPQFTDASSQTVSQDEQTTTETVNIDAGDDSTSNPDTDVTYTLSGTDSDEFDITSSDGSISPTNALDYESPSDSDGNNDYELTVTATDDAGNTNTQSVTVNINDVAENPTFNSGNTASVDEDATSPTDVIDVNADVGGNDDEGVSYAFIAGNSDSAYAIDSGTGQITVNDGSQLDHETSSSRTVTVEASEDGSTSTQDITIDVNDLNEAPTASDNTVTINEDNDKEFGKSEFGFSDEDSGDSLQSVEVSSIPSSGTLYIDSDTDGTVDNGEEITSTGTTVSETEISNGEFKFKPASNENGDPYASFDFKVGDGSLYSSTYTMTIDVNSVNDAPSLDSSTYNLDNIAEDADSNGGTTVSNILADGGTTDPDGDTLGLAAVGVTDSNGDWQYSTDGSNWDDLNPDSGTLSNTNALLLNEADYIRFVPDSNYDGSNTGSVTIRAWDQTIGSAGSGYDVSTNGGATAYSSGTASTAITVQDAPEVNSITRSSPTSPTNADSVDFNVGFSESVSGIDTTDFTTTQVSGDVAGTVSSVSSSSGTSITVTVNSISGDGELRLDLTDDDSITSDSNSVPLGGEGSSGGAGDGSFTSGETFTVDNTEPTASLTSPTGTVSSIPQDNIAVSISDTDTDVAEGTIAVTLNDGSDVLASAGTGDSAVGYDNSDEEVNIDTSSLSVSDGTVTVEVDADDTAGNSLTTHSDTFTLDTAAPTISEMDLVDLRDGNGAVNESDTVRINATVTDGVSGVSSVTADVSQIVDGVTARTLESETAADADWDGDGDHQDPDVYGADLSLTAMTNLEGEDKSATITVVDDAGNEETTDSFGSLTLDWGSIGGETDTNEFDTSGNEVVIMEDQNSNGVLNQGDKFSVRINANDTLSGVQNVTVDLSSIGLGETVNMTQYEDTSVYNTSEKTVGADYDFDSFNPSITLRDKAGNTYSLGTQEDVNLDSQAPDSFEISDISPSDGGDIELTVTDLAGDVSYYLVYRDDSQIANVSAGQTEYTDTDTSHGTTYSYTVAAVDDAENFGDNTTSVPQEADSKAPTVSFESSPDYVVEEDATISNAASLTDQGISSPSSSNTQVSMVNSEGEELFEASVGTAPELSMTDGDITVDMGQLNTGSLTEGTATLRVKPGDELGNFNDSAYENQFEVDTIHPSVESVYTVDPDTDGDVDGVEVEYSEDVENVGTDDISFTEGGWSVGSVKELSSGVVQFNLSSEIPGTAATPTVSFDTTSIQDVAGNDLESTSDTTANDSVNPVIDLEEGSNLVSFPVQDDRTLEVSDVLDTSKVDKVWKYTESGWKSWTESKAENSGFNFDIEAGEGYIVEANTGFTAQPEVDEFSSKAPPQSEVHEGWNLVGNFKEKPDQVTSDTGAVTSSGALGTVSSFLTDKVLYNSGSGTLEYQSLGSSADFNSGQAYWVQTTNSDFSGGTVAYTEN